MSVQVIAVDLGATSGRVISGVVGPQQLGHDVVHRFKNGPHARGDSLHWDATGLFDEIQRGLAGVSGEVASIGVDSWAVDYGLLNDGALLWEPHHYRDSRTAEGVERIHRQLDHRGLYPRNGLQFLPFNTIYQLACEPWEGAAQQADTLLLIPDLMGYWLTGVARTEATNASTTGLTQVDTGEFDDHLISMTGAPRSLFAPIIAPGEMLGGLLPDLARRLGFSAPVVAVGSHDTASAVVAVPMLGNECAYISCGTWGLVGVEIERPIVSEAAREANFTNERGVDNRIRFLHNVMGLWLLNESIDYWQKSGSPSTLVGLLGKASDYTGPVAVFDVNDPIFMAPGDIPVRIKAWCDDRGILAPLDEVGIVASIIESLAEAFAEAVRQAETLSGRRVSQINMVGGGAQNALLCQRLADCAGIPVIAGPVEATALGNLLVQARAVGAIRGDLDSMRALVGQTTSPKAFSPTSVGERRRHG